MTVINPGEKTTLRQSLFGLCTATLATVALLSVGNTSAKASTASVMPGPGLLVVAPAGEVNNITIDESKSAYIVEDTAGIQPGAGCTTVTATQVSCPINGNHSAGVGLGDEDDELTINAPSIDLATYVNGNQGDDRINITTDSKDTVLGEMGKDAIDTGNGDDVIDGGLDGDTINGGGGVDTVDYSGRNEDLTVDLRPGNNLAEVSSLNETDTLSSLENVKGSQGVNKIYGDDGANVLEGNDGSDVIQGLDGDDTIDGGSDNDSISGDTGGSGAPGNDVLTGGLGNDQISGQGGVDTVDYSNSAPAIVRKISLDDVANDGDQGLGEQDNVSSDVENVIGGAGNDQITGSAAPNVLVGLDGSDTFNLVPGLSGEDTVIGDDGYDSVSYEAYTEPVTASLDGVANDGVIGAVDKGLLNDVEGLTGTDYADTLIGNSADNTINALDGDDTVKGEGGSDQIDAGLGADTLDGGDGVDDMYDGGGQDDDTLAGDSSTDFLSASGGDDTLEGGPGNDDLIAGAGTDTVDYSDATGEVTVNLDQTAPNGTTGNGQSGENDTVREAENVIGSPFDDQLTASSTDATVNVLRGGAGDDTLDGGDSSDTLKGEEGDDTFKAANTFTVLDDTFEGGTGSDTVDYSGYNNPLFYQVAVNLTAGKGGLADISGSGENAVVTQTENDTYTSIENALGTSGDDYLVGNTAVNTLSGLEGNDYIQANEGRADQVLCGDGTADQAKVDQLDTPAECESVQTIQTAPLDGNNNTGGGNNTGGTSNPTNTNSGTGSATTNPVVTATGKAGKITVVGRSAKVSRNGQTKVVVKCSADTKGTCAGTLKLTAKLGKKTVTIATKKFTVAAGKQASTTLKLSKKALKALKKAKSRKLKAQTVAQSSNTAVAASSAKSGITLQLTKGK